MTLKRMTREDLPQALGAFKPVGHVMMAFRTEGPGAHRDACAARGGLEDEDVLTAARTASVLLL